MLGAIAERFSVRASAILQANAGTLTNPDNLQVGQVLSIPGGAAQPTPTAGPTPPPAATVVMQKHVIAKGEVLSTIALKYGVSVKSLRDANNLTNDTIRVGDTLNIPIDAIDANNANDANAATTTPTKYAFSILEGD